MRALWWIVGVVGFILLCLGLGAVAIPGVFLAFVILGGCFSGPRAKLVLVTIGLVGLALQFSLYRIYGSAQIVKTPPLPGARVVTALEPPSLLRFADGGTAELPSVYFPQAVKFDELSDTTFRFYDYAGNLTKTPTAAVRMKGDGTAEFQRHCRYFCGNTFFPTFFPGRLPSHKTADFGQYLIRSGLAFPVLDEASLDVTKANPILDLLDAADGAPSVMDAILVPPGDEHAISLGRRLATPGSRYFVAGAYLLLAAQDTDSYPRLASEVRRRKRVNADGYNFIAQCRCGSLDHLLERLLPENDQLPWRRYPSTEFAEFGEAMQQLVWTSADRAKTGDLAVYDTPFRDWRDGLIPAGHVGALSKAATKFFRWPANSRGFHEWYANVRPRLRSGRDEGDRLVFWLEGGKPFDQQYMESMTAFTGAAQPRR